MDEVMRSKYAHKWLAALGVELGQMHTKGVIERIRRRDIPRGHRPLPAKIVFDCKKDANGRIKKFKARLVAKGAKGFLMKKGRDYKSTYAPVTSYFAVKALLSVANRRGMVVFGTDVDGAFLQSDLKEELYLEVDGVYCRLHKTLYGWTQAVRVRVEQGPR